MCSDGTCDDCIALENAGLGHLEVFRISRCTRCGAAEGETDGVNGVHRLAGNWCTECVLDVADASGTDTYHLNGGEP